MREISVHSPHPRYQHRRIIHRYCCRCLLRGQGLHSLQHSACIKNPFRRSCSRVLRRCQGRTLRFERKQHSASIISLPPGIQRCGSDSSGDPHCHCGCNALESGSQAFYSETISKNARPIGSNLPANPLFAHLI